MRFYLSTLLFFVFVTRVFTQSSEEQFYIEIDEETAFELHDLPVHIDTVVDARGAPDKPFGIGFRGLGSQPVDLFIKDDIGEAFSRIFDKSIQQRAEKKSILRVTFLSINEYVSAYSQRREIALEAEIATPTDNGYAIYGPRRIMEESSSGFDVTNRHDKAIVSILERMIRELVAFDHNAAEPTIVGAEQVLQPSNRYNIETTPLSTIPDGVFPTFMDFRAGASKPLFQAKLKKTVVVHTDSTGREFSVIKLAPDGLLDYSAFNNIWGVQYKGRPYLKIGDFSYEVKRTEAGQLICAVPEAIFKRNPNAGLVVMTGAMFGAVGSSLAYIISTPGGKSNLGVRTIELPTGRISYFGEGDANALGTRGAPQIAMVSSPRNKRRRPLTLTLEDGRNFLFKPGEYVQLPKETDICLSSVSDIFPECSTLTALRGRDQVVFEVKEVGRGNFRIESLSRRDARLFFQQVYEGKRKKAVMTKRVE